MGPFAGRCGRHPFEAKTRSCDAMSLVARGVPVEMTGVPTMAAHVDMTHAGPDGQIRYPLCPEASQPADPCSAQISLEATAPDARQEMIRNPDIVTCIAVAEATEQPLLKARRNLVLVGNRARCLRSYPAI
jgi:hypothetical protein